MVRGEESLISYKDYISDLGRGTSPLITQWTVLAQPRPAGGSTGRAPDSSPRKCG